MSDFKDAYRGEWKAGDAPFVNLDQSVCEVTVGEHTFVYVVQTHQVDHLKEWLVVGNWFGDGLPEYGPQFEGKIDDFYELVGLRFREFPLTWPPLERCKV
jgi:hypothetical protein